MTPCAHVTTTIAAAYDAVPDLNYTGVDVHPPPDGSRGRYAQAKWCAVCGALGLPPAGDEHPAADSTTWHEPKGTR